VKVAVLGTGLIGGSIGLAARARAGAHVSGWDPDPAALRAALESGAIDEAAADVAAAVEGAEVVFAAAPVGVLAETVRLALEHAGDDCVVSDVGSTKLALEEARRDGRFFGGHPLAGAENSGVAHAREDLFEGATWFLAASPDNSPDLYERLCSLIEGMGAHPRQVAADAHDRLMATVSHLPHVLANLLVAQAAAAFERERCEPRGGTGPSFRDAVRTAGSNSAVWIDIYLAGREPLIAAIDELTGRLAEVRTALDAGDGGALKAWNENARSDRETLLGQGS
jgi:prephenate dehydrogenase